MEKNIQHKQTKRYLIWRILQFALPIIIALIILSDKWDGLVGLPALVFGIYTLWRLISWIFNKFEFNEKHINFKHGILFTKTNLIEFKNIQNVDITAGPLMRVLGLARVSFWTSSNKMFMRNGNGKTYAEEIIYLKRSNAEYLKSFISTQNEEN